MYHYFDRYGLSATHLNLCSGFMHFQKYTTNHQWQIKCMQCTRRSMYKLNTFSKTNTRRYIYILISAIVFTDEIPAKLLCISIFAFQNQPSQQEIQTVNHLELDEQFLSITNNHIAFMQALSNHIIQCNGVYMVLKVRIVDLGSGLSVKGTPEHHPTSVKIRE